MNIFNSTLGHKLIAETSKWLEKLSALNFKEKQFAKILTRELIFVIWVESKIKCVGLKMKASSLFIQYFYMRDP